MFGNKNRGMLLESVINRTIDFYQEHNVAIIHKKEIPIRFKSVISHHHSLQAENSYIVGKSTTDYYGVYQGKFLAFEAKSTKLNALPAKNIQKHQIEYLNSIRKHRGFAFFVILFSSIDRFIFLDIKFVLRLNGHSITIDYAQKNGIILDLAYPGIIDFIAPLAKIIEK